MPRQSNHRRSEYDNFAPSQLDATSDSSGDLLSSIHEDKSIDQSEHSNFDDDSSSDEKPGVFLEPEIPVRAAISDRSLDSLAPVDQITEMPRPTLDRSPMSVRRTRIKSKGSSQIKRTPTGGAADYKTPEVKSCSSSDGAKPTQKSEKTPNPTLRRENSTIKREFFKSKNSAMTS